MTRSLPSGKGTATGLAPEALWATRNVAAVACGLCGFQALLSGMAAKRWSDRICPRYRCKGTLAFRGDMEESYYARIYRSGRIQRTFAAEHTGLLQRPDVPGQSSILVAALIERRDVPGRLVRLVHDCSHSPPSKYDLTR